MPDHTLPASTEIAASQIEPSPSGPWRVGGKVPLNVYEGDKPMFQCHTPEDAARIVDKLNFATVALLKEAASPSVEWRPIETAPKDGTTLLLCGPGHSIACGWWEEEVNGYNDPGWTDGTVQSFGYETVTKLDPTHWMPIPPTYAAIISAKEKG